MAYGGDDTAEARKRSGYLADGLQDLVRRHLRRLTAGRPQISGNAAGKRGAFVQHEHCGLLVIA
jgi:hypothetical protein